MAKNDSKGIKPADSTKKIEKPNLAEAAKPVQKPIVKKVAAPAPEPPLIPTEEVIGANKPTGTQSVLTKIGRLSPDSLVTFKQQLKETYIDTDAPSAHVALSIIQIADQYLTRIALIQIGEDMPALGGNFATSTLQTLLAAAEQLQVQVTKAIPSSASPAQTEIQFNPETIPVEVKEKVETEEKIGATQIDLDPALVRTAEELKLCLQHILMKDKTKSSNLPEALAWLQSNQVVPQQQMIERYVEKQKFADDAARDADNQYKDMCKVLDLYKNTKKVDLFNQLLEICGADTPLMVTGICKAIWNRYILSDTCLPVHFFVQGICKSWTDEEIKDFVIFVVNMEAERAKKLEYTNEKDLSFLEKVTSLQNTTAEYLDKLVDSTMAGWESNGRNAEAKLIQNNFMKFVTDKRVVQKDRVASVLQNFCNLYSDQSKQTERLSKYKDLSAYSNEPAVASEGPLLEKKN